MSKQYEYKVEDIFEDIPNDPKNVKMTIPPEIMEQVGLESGDTIKISYGDQGTLILEKVDEKISKQPSGQPFDRDTFEPINKKDDKKENSGEEE